MRLYVCCSDGAEAGAKKGGAGCTSDDEKDGSVEGGVERSESRDDEQSRSTVGGKGGAAERKGMQKYVNIPSDPAAGAAQDGTGDRRGAAGIAVAGSAYEGGAAQIPPQQQAGAGSIPASKGGTGLATLARAGKLFNTQSIFDLEVSKLKADYYCMPFITVRELKFAVLVVYCCR